MPRATLFKLLRNLVLFAAAIAGGPAMAGTYRNDRYGFSLHYPTLRLTAEPESDNGDGRRFTAGGPVTVAAFAYYRQDQETPESIAADAEADCKGSAPTYRVVRQSLVAISCIHGGTVLYRKTILDADLEITLDAEYPARDKARWDKVVAAMAGSLRGPVH